MQIAPEKAIFRNREVAEPHNPEVIVDQMEQSRHLAAKIQTLPDRQREAVVLRYYQDLAFKDIAKILDISLSTAKMRVYRGLENLADLLKLEEES
jgi:RNA polymerase sigma-70 factor (ECF subfamily)